MPVSGTFWIAEGGRFELEVRQPATKEQRQQLHPDVPPLNAGTLAVRVTGHGTTRDNRVETFEWSGGADENIFSSLTLFTLPDRGTYSFSMLRRDPADSFLERAPSITLERAADPASLGLGYALAKFLGVALLAGSAIAAMAMVLDRGTGSHVE